MRGTRETASRPGWNWPKHVQNFKEGQEMPLLELVNEVGTTYGVGSDTTTMAMEVFIMATVLYGAPFVPKARKEIDDVARQNRMPAFSNIPALPYFQAVVNEVLHWHPVSVGGILYAVTKDAEYIGYRIPAGATVIGNH